MTDTLTRTTEGRTTMFTREDREHGKTLIAGLNTAAESVVFDQPALTSGITRAVVTSSSILIKGEPGVGKTEGAYILTDGVVEDLTIGWVQGNRELLPTDLSGAHYRQADGSFVFRPGPIVKHLLVIDELTRAKGLAYAMLLAAMERGEVVVQGPTVEVVNTPSMFAVIATTNNPERDPELAMPPPALLDRFATMVVVETPSQETLTKILEAKGGRPGIRPRPPKVMDLDELDWLQELVYSVTVPPRLRSYIAAIGTAFTPVLPEIGADTSPRAALSIQVLARYNAAERGSGVVTKENIDDCLVETLQHRIVLNNTRTRRGESIHMPSFIKGVVSGIEKSSWK